MRTDDLESVRVERAIKRVRSDIAAHITSPSTVNVTMHNLSVLPDGKRTETSHEPPREEATNGEYAVLEHRPSRSREDLPETHQRDDSSMPDTDPTPSLANSEDVSGARLDDAASVSASANSVIEIEASDTGSIALPKTSPSLPSSAAAAAAPTDGIAPVPVPSDQAVDSVSSTPIPAEHPARIPRSQSADPDKAARLSRVYTPSATSGGVSGTETTSASASATEDDSSVNTSRERRKKRSKSAPRAKERVSRKVQVSDFEMMRVLGKGCAGKVLLVRYKNSSDLYALKAITKRHVLAHQELQHTLTEQAVLRRMAAEGTDPFVVKLWWSFHDRENLFLVMVRPAYTHIRCSRMFDVDIHRDRTSTLAVILRRSWHAGADLDVTVPVFMLPKSLKVSRACMPRVSFIVTSNRKTSLLLPMAISYLLTLGSPRSSHVAVRNMPRQVLRR